MSCDHTHGCCGLGRRELLKAAGLAAAGLLARRSPLWAADPAPTETHGKGPAAIRAAFLYPPSELLKKQGYYSWPGSGFDAEGHHKLYAGRIAEMCKALGVRLIADRSAFYEKEAVDRFIREVREQKPDGLLLVAFKKSEWPSIGRIVDETGVPTIAMATIGVLLMPHIREMQARPGVFTISSLDNFDAIRDGIRMIRTRRWMRDAVILSIADGQPAETRVPFLGTLVRGVPMKAYADLYKSTPTDEALRKVAAAYAGGCRERREPNEADVLEAARAHIALRKLIEQHRADAMMMQCLDGIAKRIIPPPCMSFMDLRDEGVVAGCQNDLDATLTMMIGQQLFERPGFQHNPACDTAKNLFYGSHCTSPRRLEGPAGPGSDYILRNHAEAGVGTVPQVLWPEGKEITIGQYVVGEKPAMYIYTGRTVTNYDTPPAGGCRTALCAALNEVPACELKAEHMLHPTMWLGDHGARLKGFCRMFGIMVKT